MNPASEQLCEDEKPAGFDVIEETVSICPKCMDRVDASIASKNGSVYLLKRCPIHGEQMELLEKDELYYRARTQYDKPGTDSIRQTQIKRGCPFDCGLCTDHAQHTCIGIIEINSSCDLTCPECYVGDHSFGELRLEKVSEMMDFFQRAESNKAEILQISGGEPTMHPEILDILQIAKEKHFKYVLLNTNGLRIAKDRSFVNELAKLVPGFEIYLQFDGFEPSTYLELRGQDLTELKATAIRNLSEAGIGVTLVATVKKNCNDHEVGAILEYGVSQPCVRGINYQPLAYFSGSNRPPPDRITLTEVLQLIEKQTNGQYRFDDFVPLPCDVERVAITMCTNENGRFVPITRKIDVKDYLPIINNTFAFNADEYLRFAKGDSPLCACVGDFVRKLGSLIPARYSSLSTSEKSDHFARNLFRVSVSSFVDCYNFDVRSMQKECAHFITPDLRRIPFSAYNMFYRK